MSDRAPRKRKGQDTRGEKSLRGEARRFLGTPMQSAMIRGLENERRAQAWVGVAYEKYKEGDIGEATYLDVVEKLKDAKER